MSTPRNLLGVDVPVNVPNPQVQRQLANTYRNIPYDNSKIIIAENVDDVQTALETLGLSAQQHELDIRALETEIDDLSAAIVENREAIADVVDDVAEISGALSGFDARITALEEDEVYAKEVIYELETAGVTASPYLAPLSAGTAQEAIDYLITRYDPFVRHSEAERMALTWGLPETGYFVYQTDKDRGLYEWTGFEWNKLGVTQEGGTIVRDASVTPDLSGGMAVGTWVWWDDDRDMFIPLTEMITFTNPNSGAGGLDPYINDDIIDKMREDTVGVVIERKMNEEPDNGKTEWLVDVLVHGAANIDEAVAGTTYYFEQDGTLTDVEPVDPLQPIKVGFSPNDGVLYVDIEYPRLQKRIFGGTF